MTVLTDLDEKNLAVEMINHLLKPLGPPPFDGDIVLAAGGDEPKRNRDFCELEDLREPSLFLVRKVDMPLKLSGLNRQTQFLI